MKIPVTELAFIRGQRDKTGSIGLHQIGLPDLPEHSRHVKRQKRQEDEKRRIAEYKATNQLDVSIPSNEIILSYDENNDDEEQLADCEDGMGGSIEATLHIPSKSTTSNKNPEYNTLDVPNVALQSIRYGVGLRATAAITTAAFMDAGLITDGDKKLVVDHNKDKRAQERIMKSVDHEFNDLCMKGTVECIFFDSRNDITKVMLKADNSDRQFPSIIKEEHYAVCSKPGGRYL